MKSIFILFFIVVIFIGGFSLGIILSFSSDTKLLYGRDDPKNVVFSSGNGGSSINVPAVNQNGQGVVTKLNVGIKNGTGQVLVDINQIIFWGDTQESIQIAKNVATNATNTDVSNIDITYSIKSEAAIIEGQSAGAALTVATIAAITNKTFDKDIMITGTIDRNGEIGPVGGIIEKARASKESGAKLFLVPEGQSVIRETKPVTVCTEVARFDWCRIKFVENTTNVEDLVGIDIEEVNDIQDVLKYFDVKI